jgi:hypothetical protein
MAATEFIYKVNFLWKNNYCIKIVTKTNSWFEGLIDQIEITKDGNLNIWFKPAPYLSKELFPDDRILCSVSSIESWGAYKEEP